MQLIAKLMNLKDHLQKQILMGILYRKLVIWMDLNIQSDEFVHSSKLHILSLSLAGKESISCYFDYSI